MSDDKVCVSEIIITDESNARVFLSNGCELVGLTHIACEVKSDELPAFQIDGYIYAAGGTVKLAGGKDE